ncbi:MAG TPA: gamma carbonic anhydrase family protein [Atribacterota bacterium]|nr:gamma carbonic anhydrase family protein [Atribacterota bacterium]
MIVKFKNKTPQIDQTALVVENATLIGEVYVGKYSSIWFSAVLRADISLISIGDSTSIQDGTVLHVAENLPTKIGNYVTIGHGAILEGCIVEDTVLIGSGANILNGVNIVLTKGYTLTGFPKSLITIGNGLFLGIPIPFYIFVIFSFLPVVP